MYNSTSTTSTGTTNLNKNEVRQIFREELERKDTIDTLKEQLDSGEITKSEYLQEMQKVNKVQTSYPNSYTKCYSSISYVA